MRRVQSVSGNQVRRSGENAPKSTTQILDVAEDLRVEVVWLRFWRDVGTLTSSSSAVDRSFSPRSA